jgi:hypothetical protein
VACRKVPEHRRGPERHMLEPRMEPERHTLVGNRVVHARSRASRSLCPWFLLGQHPRQPEEVGLSSLELELRQGQRLG